MKQNYKAKTRDIIALCQIIINSGDFEQFDKKLMDILSPNYNRNFVMQLAEISRGKFKIGARKAKNFYRENKELINTINLFSNIERFIENNYGSYTKKCENLHFFYQYILTHKEQINQITLLLMRLKQLGFEQFEFNCSLDFKREIYEVDAPIENNLNIIYVANAEVIPGSNNSINYKTSNSNYKMQLGVVFDEISNYEKNIVLNSLLFDINTLPQSINTETTYGHLLALKQKQKDMSSLIKNSVDLNICVTDFEILLQDTYTIINGINEDKNKQEFSNALANMKKAVEQLKDLSKKYDDSLSLEEPALTKEDLHREKILALNKREWSKIDSY